MSDQNRQRLTRGTVVRGVVDRLHTDGRGVMTAVNGAGELRDVLVRGACPGDNVEAQIHKKRRGRFEAEAVAVIEPGIMRRTPACIHVWECGGCRWQQWDRATQLRMKRDIVIQAFADEHPDGDVDISETLDVSTEFGYRNKMEFTFGRKKFGPDAGKLVVGLHRPGRFDWVFDVERCYLPGDRVSEVVARVRRWAHDNELQPYDQKRHTGLLRHLVIREAGVARGDGDLMVNLVATDDQFNALNELTHALTNDVQGVSSLLVSVNTQRGDTAKAEKTRVLSGNATIVERLGIFDIEVSPESFLQTNTSGAERLYDLAAEAANLTGTERVLDLYCGTGLIGLWLAPHAEQVVGLESVPEAVTDAERLRSQIGVENIRFELGMAETILPQWASAGEQFDVAVVDPPRMGLHPKAMSALVRLAPKRIVYVSCNPRSLAHDVSELELAGYRTGLIQPVDMFPQTAHVECVTALQLH
jgi:23S rRNA (uracil1939-C5)-methyltransferase